MSTSLVDYLAPSDRSLAFEAGRMAYEHARRGGASILEAKRLAELARDGVAEVLHAFAPAQTQEVAA